MNNNSEAIKIFCSHLCVGDGILPLEPAEWSTLTRLLHRANMQPEDLLNLSCGELKLKLQIDDKFSERLMRLIDRSASLAFELSQYSNIGINVVTRADNEYPIRLKKALGNTCPPLFYYAGNLQLLKERCVGYVGSRAINDEDLDFTKKTIAKTMAHGFWVVSGGAKGIDSISENEALQLGGGVVEFLSDSLIRRLKVGVTNKAIQDGRLLLLSVVKPDAGFNTGIAMMRNRYIYAQSEGTVVIKSDYNKGGTWMGALENLKHGWCAEFCWDNKHYAGNQELIKRKAIPIGEDWDGNVTEYGLSKNPTQISLFED